MKKAFTLAETLVSVLIIGVVASVTLSSLKHVKPNTCMVMFRKAYNITANAVGEMTQNISYYTGDLSNLSTTTALVEGEYPEGTSKFCKIFMSFVNTIDASNCSASGVTTFSTADGITWYLPAANFSGREQITVDVNGDLTPPNCSASSSTCKNPDIFVIEISPSGKLYLTDAIAREYLKKPKNIQMK